MTSWSPLPSDPKITNRCTSLSSTSRGWLMKMHRKRKLLCHTDNLHAWRSDRAPLWNHFPVFRGGDCLDVQWLVIVCVFVMESEVRPAQMEEAGVLELNSITGHPYSTLTPCKPKLYCLEVTVILKLASGERKRRWLPLTPATPLFWFQASVKRQA